MAEVKLRPDVGGTVPTYVWLLIAALVAIAVLVGSLLLR